MSTEEGVAREEITRKGKLKKKGVGEEKLWSTPAKKPPLGPVALAPKARPQVL